MGFDISDNVIHSFHGLALPCLLACSSLYVTGDADRRATGERLLDLEAGRVLSDRSNLVFLFFLIFPRWKERHMTSSVGRDLTSNH